MVGVPQDDSGDKSVIQKTQEHNQAAYLKQQQIDQQNAQLKQQRQNAPSSIKEGTFEAQQVKKEEAQDAQQAYFAGNFQQKGSTADSFVAQREAALKSGKFDYGSVRSSFYSPPATFVTSKGQRVSRTPSPAPEQAVISFGTPVSGTPAPTLRTPILKISQAELQKSNALRASQGLPPLEQVATVQIVSPTKGPTTQPVTRLTTGGKAPIDLRAKLAQAQGSIEQFGGGGEAVSFLRFPFTANKGPSSGGIQSTTILDPLQFLGIEAGVSLATKGIKEIAALTKGETQASDFYYTQIKPLLSKISKPEQISTDIKLVNLSKESELLGFTYPSSPSKIFLNVGTKHAESLTPEEIQTTIEHETLHNVLNVMGERKASIALDKLLEERPSQLEQINISHETLTPKGSSISTPARGPTQPTDIGLNIKPSEAYLKAKSFEAQAARLPKPASVKPTVTPRTPTVPTFTSAEISLGKGLGRTTGKEGGTSATDLFKPSPPSKPSTTPPGKEIPAGKGLVQILREKPVSKTVQRTKPQFEQRQLQKQEQFLKQQLKPKQTVKTQAQLKTEDYLKSLQKTRIIPKPKQNQEYAQGFYPIPPKTKPQLTPPSVKQKQKFVPGPVFIPTPPPPSPKQTTVPTLVSITIPKPKPKFVPGPVFIPTPPPNIPTGLTTPPPTKIPPPETPPPDKKRPPFLPLLGGAKSGGLLSVSKSGARKTYIGNVPIESLVGVYKRSEITYSGKSASQINKKQKTGSNNRNFKLLGSKSIKI